MKYKLILLFAVLLSCSVLMAQKDTITIISFNVRMNTKADGKNAWDKRKSATLQMVKQEKPTLLCLQEALPEQKAFLEMNLKDYRAIGVGREDGHSMGEHMAIFYLAGKYELLEYGDFWLSETPDKVSKGWDAACHRIVTWGLFRHQRTGTEFYCFNTHLDHVGEVARRESILLIKKKISEIVKDEKLPLVLTGDFNSSTDNEIFAPLKESLLEARKSAVVTDNKGTFNSYGTSPNNIVIDHILVRNCKALIFKTLDGNYGKPFISDHYPVKAVLEY